jgi:hypothetical protein
MKTYGEDIIQTKTGVNQKIIAGQIFFTLIPKEKN